MLLEKAANLFKIKLIFVVFKHQIHFGHPMLKIIN